MLNDSFPNAKLFIKSVSIGLTSLCGDWIYCENCFLYLFITFNELSSILGNGLFLTLAMASLSIVRASFISDEISGLFKLSSINFSIKNSNILSLEISSFIFLISSLLSSEF